MRDILVAATGLMVILVGALIVVYMLNPRPAHRKPIKTCNCKEYQVELESEYFIIYDGNRVVDTIPYGTSPIDTVFMTDNL